MERRLPEDGHGRGGGLRNKGKIGIMVGALGKNGGDQFWSWVPKKWGFQINMMGPFSSPLDKSLRTISATSQNEIELIFSECQPPNGSIVRGRSTIGLRGAAALSKFF